MRYLGIRRLGGHLLKLGLLIIILKSDLFQRVRKINTNPLQNNIIIINLIHRRVGFTKVRTWVKPNLKKSQFRPIPNLIDSPL